jgi:hypothetical protein
LAVIAGDVKVRDADALSAPAALTFVPEGRLWHWVMSPENATRDRSRPRCQAAPARIA